MLKLNEWSINKLTKEISMKKTIMALALASLSFTAQAGTHYDSWTFDSADHCPVTKMSSPEQINNANYNADGQADANKGAVVAMNVSGSQGGCSSYQWSFCSE